MHNKKVDALEMMVERVYSDIEVWFARKRSKESYSEITIGPFMSKIAVSSSMLATALTFEVLVSVHSGALEVRKRAIIPISSDQKRSVAQPLLGVGVQQDIAYLLAFHTLSDPRRLRELLDISPDVESPIFPTGWERDYSPLDR